MKVRAKVQLRRRGDLRGHLMKVEKAVAEPRQVKVGFPAGKAPGGVIQIAIWNHFGTAGGASGGGWGGPVPARPFITVAMFKGRGQIRALTRKIAQAAIKTGAPLKTGLQMLGEAGKNRIQDQIAANMPPPNSPVTVARKGSSRTLIDSGRMRQSVTWQIVEGMSAGASAGRAAR